jgi:O-antigen ligase
MEMVVLGLVFLSSALGMFLFGAVRLWSIGPLSLGVFAALAAYGMWLFRRAEMADPLPAPPGLMPALVFLLYAGVHLFLVPPHYPARVKWLMMATAPAAYFLWCALSGPGWRWRFWLCALLLMISAVGWYAIVQHARGARGVLNLVRPEGYGMRASGTYFCPNHFAHMLVIGICAGLALAAAPGAGPAPRLIGGYAAMLLLYPLSLTHSRAAALGLAAGVATLVLLLAARRGLRRFAMAAGGVLALLAAAAWGIWRRAPVWRGRFEEALRGIHSGLDFRPLCWRGTIEMIRQRPLWGWGGGSYAWAEPAFQRYAAGRTAVYAHNEPLHLAAEYGLVGAFLLALIAGAWLWRAVLLVRRSPQAREACLTAGAAAVLVATLVHGLFDYNLHIYSNSHAVLMVMGVAMSLQARAGGLPRWAWTPRLRRALGAALTVAGLLLFVAMFATGASYGVMFLGDAARDRREDDRAERYYRLAARLDPGNFNAWREIGWIYRTRAIETRDPARGEVWVETALAAYRRAERINPYDEDVLFGLAQIHRLRGEEEAALRTLQRIVQLHPKRPFYFKQLGYQLERMGREKEALEAFRQAQTLGDSGLDVRWKIRLLSPQKTSPSPR